MGGRELSDSCNSDSSSKCRREQHWSSSNRRSSSGDLSLAASDRHSDRDCCTHLLQEEE